MKTECYPISILPRQSRLFLDYVQEREPLTPFYPVAPFPGIAALRESGLTAAQRAAAAELIAGGSLHGSSGDGSHPGPKALENIDRLRQGASAVVTGQQVGLFGGPLLTLLKAATAVRLAQDASAAGKLHVPIFWLASEDHDFAEVSQVTFPSRHDLHRLKLKQAPAAGSPVGGFVPGEQIGELLDETAAFLGGTEFYDRLRAWYAPGRTMAQSFAALVAHVFAPWGLLVLDAASPAAHRLGAPLLREALLRADELRAALETRDRELKASGYHAQVLVGAQSSLLFLLDAETGARLPLRRLDGQWKAGPRVYEEGELLAVLDRAPERLSPNALLRPVFQDTILPTSAYVGGPSEIAYFAQSQVLYERLLGRTTPILPRLSATLVEPAVAALLAQHETTLPQVIESGDELAQRLGARAIPIAVKRKLASAGNALDTELGELTASMATLDEGLGRAAEVSASKMRYQMNRLRRLAANYQLQREASLRRHADALKLALFPERHPQERNIGGAYYLARYGEEMAALLVDAADSTCPGHKGIWLA